MKHEVMPEWKFDGDDIDHERDCARLTGQLKRVYEYMHTHEWCSLQDISEATSDPEASVSAQIRNLRKDRFGAHTIDRKYHGNGLYEYKMTINNAV